MLKKELFVVFVSIFLLVDCSDPQCSGATDASQCEKDIRIKKLEAQIKTEQNAKNKFKNQIDELYEELEELKSNPGENTDKINQLEKQLAQANQDSQKREIDLLKQIEELKRLLASRPSQLNPEPELGRCPFPGVPANAYGKVKTDKFFSWDDTTTLFNEGDIFAYNCLYKEIDEGDEPNIICQKDGHWSDVEGSVLDRVNDLQCEDRTVDLILETWGTWNRLFDPDQAISEDRFPRYPGLTSRCNNASLADVHAFHLIFNDDRSAWIRNVEVETCGTPLKGVGMWLKDDSFKFCRNLLLDGKVSKWDCEFDQPANILNVFWGEKEKGKLRKLKASLIPKLACGLPKVPLNAEIDGKSSVENQEMAINCKEGFRRIGFKSSVTCDFRTGTWSRIPECVKSNLVARNCPTNIGSNSWCSKLLRDRCHCFSTVDRSWTEADAFCKSKQTKLVSIETKEENDLITIELGNRGYKNTEDGDNSFWTSGSDSAVEGAFIWTSTGQPINFTNWLPNEPNQLNGGDEDYIIMNYLTPGKWNDAPNNRKQYGYTTYTICESNQ